MRPVTFSLTAPGVTPPIVLDYRSGGFQVTLDVKYSTGAAGGGKVQYTTDDIWAAGWNAATADWRDHPTLSGFTGSIISNLAFPVTAVRLNMATLTAGTVALKVIESSNPMG